MYKVRRLLKKAFTPITIMLIPHTDRKSLSIKVPSVGILASVIIWCIGMGYVFSIAVYAFEYNSMKQKLNYYSEEFVKMKSTIAALKEAEEDFQRLFSYKSKEKVLENIDTLDTGSIDIESLKQEIKLSFETVGEIKDYLKKQHNKKEKIKNFVVIKNISKKFENFIIIIFQNQSLTFVNISKKIKKSLCVLANNKDDVFLICC